MHLSVNPLCECLVEIEKWTKKKRRIIIIKQHKKWEEKERDQRQAILFKLG